MEGSIHPLCVNKFDLNLRKKLNKRNTTDCKQVLAEISKTRDVFTELEDFFRKIAPDFQIVLDMLEGFREKDE